MGKYSKTCEPTSKMKSTLVLLTILAPLISAVSLPEEVEISHYVKLVNELHRGPPVQRSYQRANVETRWISQKLDNFDDNNDKEWKQRVLINEDFFLNGAPIFLILGGEGEVSPSYITYGLWVDIAREHRGSLVLPEHRFYGESIPISPLPTENLKYQSAKQALADIANVIKVLKKENKYRDSKVVVLGCSYAGTLAVWLKNLYPDLIVGCWASSAPLKVRVDFKDYTKLVGEAYRKQGGEYCYNLIDNATSYYQYLFASGQGAQVKKLFNLCDDFDVNNEKDQWTLFSNIALSFVDSAQYQRPQTNDLANKCTHLRNLSPDDASALSQFVQSNIKKAECLELKYNNVVKNYKLQLKYAPGISPSIWLYQLCSEFGWFQTASSNRQPFGLIPLDFFTDQCYDNFGPKFDKAHVEKYVEATKIELDALDLVDNVYLSYCDLDPWKEVGATEEKSAVIIPMCSHCGDLGSISENDTPELIASKWNVIKLVREWLK